VWAGMVKNRFLIWLMHRIEKIVYRRAAHIIVVTEAARANLMRKGVPPERVSVESHWIDDQMFTEPSDSHPVRAAFGLVDRFVVMFAGNIGLVQALDCVLEAAHLLRSTRIVFAIVGDGADRERLQQIARDKQLNNVVFVPRQPMDRMPAVLGAADALLVHLKASPLADLALPSKTLAYLASGKPVIMAVGGDAAELIRRARAGIVIPPENAQALAVAAQELERAPADTRAQMGRNGLEFLLAYHSKRKVINDYVNLINAYARP
jgi:colanic acid biosynthesis glycosyl transferase WcaI